MIALIMLEQCCWKLKFYSTIFIFLYGLTTLVSATSQIPEEVDYEGKVYRMYSTPLETLFSIRAERPKIFSESLPPTSCYCG